MRLVDVDDERFWDILFDEACVEGRQAERIGKELGNIISYDAGKIVGQLELYKAYYEKKAAEYDEIRDVKNADISDAISHSYGKAIEIVKAGGVNENR